MRGIQLNLAVKMFGFKDGFSFWFRWSFIHPIQTFVWLYITHKPYCTYHGWHCPPEKYVKKCNHLKLLTIKEIKQHWEEAHEEMNHVEKGPNGECAYCGDNPGEVEIPNPNSEALSKWLVCKICKCVIETQQRLCFAAHINDQKTIKECHSILSEIARRTGTPIMNAEISREGFSSVTYGEN